MSTKTITKTKNISSFSDVRNDENNEDDEYIKMMLLEIDELNKKLNNERQSNNKNDVYIEVLEEELNEIYSKYTKLQNDVKYLENFKEVSKMTNNKTQALIKEKLSNKDKNKYTELPTDELRKIANDRLNVIKQKFNIS
jgi:hypothetical protein